MTSMRTRIGYALLGVVLLAGGGAFAAANGYLRAPQSLAAPQTTRTTAAPGEDDLVPGTAGPRAGECRSSLDDLPEGSNRHAAFDEPMPVLAIAGEPVDAQVSMTNTGPLDLEDVVQGGPVLLVSDGENLVVARVESIDPMPGPGLTSGESLAFGRFAPLVHCETGEPLEPGPYQFAVAQLPREGGSPTGVSSRYGSLTVTDEVGATREPVEIPVLPACGDPIAGFELDPTFPRAAVLQAGYLSWTDDHQSLLHDPEEGWPRIELEFTYPGPDREVLPYGMGVVLARDGVVVARAGLLRFDPFDYLQWTAGSTETTSLDVGFDCTAAAEDYVSFEPSGEYTVSGFFAAEFEDEWGLADYVVIALDPVTVDFGER